LVRGKPALVINFPHDREVNVAPLEPFLKWAGGKRWLSSKLAPKFPQTINRYYEPFLGGGAIFFALQPKRATLSDSNAELINCYRQVKRDPEAVLASLKKLKNSEVVYYRVRKSAPEDPIERAARLLYLTTLSFNGIYRQNLAGDFNVPYGKKIHVSPAGGSKLLLACHALRNAKLECKDFEDATSAAGEGDLVYFDPPYTVAHGNNGFVKYNAKIFSWNDQIRLAAVAKRLADKGCSVFVSNADHISIRSLYKSFQLSLITRPSRISATVEHRKSITECLFFVAR
jgi:DNA adenine methylase